MKGLLKCYYGYRNRGDELLFFGVVNYLFDHYSDLTSLDIEVGDVSWMSQWCEMNPGLWEPYKSRVRFVTSRRFSMWVAEYDVIFAGGGEVLAQKGRSPWHAGLNYLALFWRWIWTRRVVRLGGIETPTTRWSKLLYRIMLPYAREIVCRERGSYEIAKRYTDKVVLYHDFAIDVISNYKSQITNHSGDDMLASHQKVPYFKHTDGSVAVRDDAPIKRRNGVLCIVKNTVLDSFLAIEFVKNGTIIPVVGGGIDRDEDMTQAALREIAEEAGLNELQFISKLGHIRDYFYSPHKQINRYMCFDVLYYETQQCEFELRSEEEQQIQNPLRIPANEIGQYNQRFDIRYCYELLQGKVQTQPTSRMSQQFTLVNFIPKYTNQEIIGQFHERIKDYPDHHIINFPAEEGDTLPEEIINQYGDRIQMWKRREHDIRSNLALFEQAQAGFGQRLHFIISCVYYHIPIRRLAYSEKVNKILQFFEQMEL